MLGGGTKPLTAPLLKSSPSTAPPSDEWDCRGFEAKKTSGIQMAHDGPLTSVRQGQVNSSPKTSWAAATSDAAHAANARKQRRLLQAIVASATVMLIEFVGGIYAHSLALMSDSAHMLADIASYCIALVALEVALPLDLEAPGGACGPKEKLQQPQKPEDGLDQEPAVEQGMEEDAGSDSDGDIL